MSARPQVIVVYAAGLAQGLALVTFPAASAIFTSPQFYGLSSKEYGAMFLPQAIAAVLASWLGAGWSQRAGVKRIFLLGLSADFLSMALLYASQFAVRDRSVSYEMLLVATTCLGIGFGLTVPALNTLASALSEGKADSALLMLNALLGVGTAMAPLLIAFFTRLGNWAILPLLVAVNLAALLWIGARLPMNAETSPKREARGAITFPVRFWIFGVFALLYGVVETINGNWSTLYMQPLVGAPASLSSLALTMFWATVTGGRLLFAGIARWFPPVAAFRGLPLVCAASVWLVAALKKGDSHSGILAFSLAGFGCSALLPLTISFAQQQLASIQSAVAGTMIGFYQIGYGIAAFGVGSLVANAGLSMSSLFRAAAGVSLVLSVLAFLIAAQGRTKRRLQAVA
jgi:predicted MFS family arabinose efflux permease